MSLVRLVYRSTPSKGVSITDVTKIVEKARERNLGLGVTGFLISNRKFFLQALEGSPRAVNLIYHKIVGDSRHSDPTLLLYEQVLSRTFSSWSMGYCANTEENRDVFFKYSPTNDLQLDLINGRAALEIMSELSQKFQRQASASGAAVGDKGGDTGPKISAVGS